MPITRLYLIRHGETVANREYRYIGTRDDPLSALGETQALQLAEALSGLPIEAVYSSPLQRTYQTALPIAARHGLEVQRVDDLRECNFGVWEGMSRAEVLERNPEDRQRYREWEHNTSIAPPGGESFEALQQRVVAAVERPCASTSRSGYSAGFSCRAYQGVTWRCTWCASLFCLSYLPGSRYNQRC